MEITTERFGYKIDRPNTLSGLLTTRAELAARLGFEQAALQRLISDIGHLDATIRIFDPDADTGRVARFPGKDRAPRNEMRRFVLGALRKAPEPVSSAEIAQSMIDARGLDVNNATAALMRKRVGACLTALRSGGIIREIAQVGEYKRWELISKS